MNLSVEKHPPLTEGFLFVIYLICLEISGTES